MNAVYRYIECKDILICARKDIKNYKYKNKKIRQFG